jgi:16S rRNA (uracil1498-N3)-methyltransferase
MSQAYPSIRLFVEYSLHAGAQVELSKEQAHYLGNVMRAKAGQHVGLFNGKDGEWLAEIADINKKYALLLIKEQLRAYQASPDIWLVFAPIKQGRIDYMIEKATELGVSELHPVMTRRTIVSRVNEKRLSAHVIEAAEQSERLDVPALQTPKKLEALLNDWSEDRTLLYGDETGGGETISEVIKTIAKEKLAVLIGPEGGFASEELAMLRNQSFTKPVGLGPRVLRADTAAIAALSAIQALSGDWQGKPRFRGA